MVVWDNRAYRILIRHGQRSSSMVQRQSAKRSVPSRSHRPAIALALSTVMALGFGTVIASSSGAATKEVATTWSQLSRDFSSAPNGVTTTIELGASISSPVGGQSLSVPSNHGSGGARIVLDLHGNHLAVTSQANEDDAAISVYQGASLTIEDSATGGTVTATGQYLEPGIGAAYGVTNVNTSGFFSMGSISIDGGTIIATGGEGASGIGGAYYIGGGSVTVNGGNVEAFGGSEAPGIGNGWFQDYANSPMKIAIKGGSVVATGGDGASGIGWTADSLSTGPAITIGGCASVVANGGRGGDAFFDWIGAGAGIGGGASQYSPLSQNPSPSATTPASPLIIDGAPTSGSATTAGTGSSTWSSLQEYITGAPGSPITYSGNKAFVVTATATTPSNDEKSGQFLLSCRKVYPGAPRSIHASVNGSSLTVKWSVPRRGPLPSGYLVTATPSGKTCRTASKLTCTIHGLDPSQAYRVSVTAQDSAGNGPAAALRNIQG